MSNEKTEEFLSETQFFEPEENVEPAKTVKQKLKALRRSNDANDD